MEKEPTPNREKAIFLRAKEKTTPQERSAFLDEACGDDSALRQQVEELLDSFDDAGSFLDGHAAEQVASGESLDLLDLTALRPVEEGRGKAIGPYKLLQEIGEGGMGTVYLAEQTEPVRRKVALKIIKPGMDSRRVIARFEAERQALALMEHNNIARVLDAGATDNGRPYFVMELVKGVPITRYCDENRLTLLERLKLFVPVCQAIQHAHQKGIIHRDIKPSNVLVAHYDGRPVPKVIDFGIAKATGQQLTEKTMFTQIGQIVGSLEYMSPEQAEMNQLDVDTRSDVYSLGVMLYELLTGSTPITREQLREAGFTEMLRTIRETEPPKPSTRLSESADALPSISAVRNTEPSRLSRFVRGDLDWIVMKALEKDRGRRYGTASAFANDIELYLADEPVQAGPPGSAYRMRKFARKHRRSMATAASLLLILVAGVVASAWQAIRARSEERRANQAASQATREADEARKQKEIAKSARAESDRLAAREQKSRLQAERNLYYSQITAAQNALDAGDRLAARRILDQCLADQRRWEWYYLVTQTRPTSKAMRHADAPGAASFAPDGSRVMAWIGSTGSFSVWDVATGERLFRRWPQPNDNPYFKSSAPIWSPDGKVLAWCDGQTIELLKSSSGETVQRWPALHSVFRMAWHPTKNQLATLGIEGIKEIKGMLRIWNLDTQATIQEIETPVSTLSWQAVGWSHDGSLFAAGAKDIVDVFDCANWNKTARLEAGATVPFWGWAPHSNRLLFSAREKPNEEHPIISVWEQGKEPVPVTAWYRDAFHIAWSPDGTELAWIHQHNGTVHIHDSVTGEERKVFDPGHESYGRCVAWNRDGTRLASTGAEGSVKVWNRDSTTTKPESVLLGHERQVRWVAWNPNGEASLASFSTDKSLRFWKLDNPADASHVIPTPHPIASLSWGPDGKRVACAAEQIARLPSSVQVWDSETGKPLGEAFSPAGWSTDWSRQNRLLCTQPDRWTVRMIDPDAKVDMTVALANRPETLPEGVVKGSGVRWSPDGRWLATATFEGAYIWDVARRLPIHLKNTKNPTSGWVISLAWRPDGSQLAVIYRATVREGVHEVVVYDFDIPAEKFRARWRQQRPPTGFPSELAWSPDGKLIALWAPDQSICLWRAENGDLVSVHRGHASEVKCIDWSPDGARFATAGEDGTVRIWSPQSEQAVLTLRGHTRAVSAVRWNQDGMRLASAGLDGAIRIWDAREGYVAARSEQALAALNDRLDSQPDDQNTLKIRAELLMRSGQWKKAGGDLDRWLRLQETTGQRKKWYSTGWWVSGPCQETHLKAPTELLEQNALGAAFRRDGEKLTTQRIDWRYLEDSDQHYLDLRQEFDADGISAYALTRIYSAREQEVGLSVRADDAVGIWINGKLAHADEEGRVRTIGDVPSEFLAKLRPGWNVLLAKVVNAPDTDRFELSVEITDQAVDKVGKRRYHQP